MAQVAEHLGNKTEPDKADHADKKLVEPKAKKSYKEMLIFHAKDPAITVSRDAMDGGWEVVVSPKPDDF